MRPGLTALQNAREHHARFWAYSTSEFVDTAWDDFSVNSPVGRWCNARQSITPTVSKPTDRPPTLTLSGSGGVLLSKPIRPLTPPSSPDVESAIFLKLEYKCNQEHVIIGLVNDIDLVGTTPAQFLYGYSGAVWNSSTRKFTFGYSGSTRSWPYNTSGATKLMSDEFALYANTVKHNVDITIYFHKGVTTYARVIAKMDGEVKWISDYITDLTNDHFAKWFVNESHVFIWGLYATNVIVEVHSLQCSHSG